MIGIRKSSKRLPGAYPFTGGVPYNIFVDAAAVPQIVFAGGCPDNHIVAFTQSFQRNV